MAYRISFQANGNTGFTVPTLGMARKVDAAIRAEGINPIVAKSQIVDFNAAPKERTPAQKAGDEKRKAALAKSRASKH